MRCCAVAAAGVLATSCAGDAGEPAETGGGASPVAGDASIVSPGTIDAGVAGATPVDGRPATADPAGPAAGSMERVGPAGATALARGERYVPLDDGTCATLARAFALAIGVDEQPIDEVPLVDYVDPSGGTGCHVSLAESATVMANVPSFPGELGASDAIGAQLEALGWRRDAAYDGDSPNAAARGYRRGDGLCLTAVRWLPPDEAGCAPGTPPADCASDPDLRLYYAELTCARDTMAASP